MQGYEYYCYDPSDDPDTRQLHGVTVTVLAATEEEALAKAKKLIARQVYRLDEITEQEAARLKSRF